MKADGFLDLVLDQLGDSVDSRAMFGGHGLYLGGIFFGIVHKGRLFFRTDAGSRPAYAKAGMRPFRPRPKLSLHAYYEVPAEVLEDRRALRAWADRASRTRPAPGCP